VNDEATPAAITRSTYVRALELLGFDAGQVTDLAFHADGVLATVVVGRGLPETHQVWVPVVADAVGEATGEADRG